MCWLFLSPSKSGKLEGEALSPPWPGCYSATAHTAELLTYGQKAQPKFWEAQPLAACSSFSCLYIQEMKSECWYKTGWTENWEAGKTWGGGWTGLKGGRCGEMESSRGSLHCVQYMWAGGCRLAAEPSNLIAFFLPWSQRTKVSCWQAVRWVFGVWKDQHVETVLSWLCSSIYMRA